MSSLRRTSQEIAKAYSRTTLRTGDIICTIRATVGSAVIVPKELDGANIDRGTARISPSSDIDHKFLLWLFQSDYTSKQLSLASKGTTFSEISLDQLRKLTLPIPSSRDEQTRIATILDTHDARIQAEEACYEKLRETKQGLMDDLLTGRVRVDELPEEILP